MLTALSIQLWVGCVQILFAVCTFWPLNVRYDVAEPTSRVGVLTCRSACRERCHFVTCQIADMSIRMS